jgi:hypothetical protein
MPGDTHPAYEDRKAAIVAWLDNPHHPYGQHMRIPYPRGLHVWEPEAEPVTTVPSFSIRMLTRRKAAGPAPYVGRPFCYQWYVGEDDLGRMVAGRTTWLRYAEDETTYMIRTGDMSGFNWPVTRPVDGEPGWPVQAAP